MLSREYRRQWHTKTQKFWVDELTRLMDENVERHVEFLLNSTGYASSSRAVSRIRHRIYWDQFIYVLAYYDKILDIRITDAPYEDLE